MTLATLITPWLALPLCAGAMLFIAGHVLALYRLDIPASRRRIRTAGGLLMLVLAPMLAYAGAVVPPADKRAFVLAWMAVMAILGLIIAVALIDVANNLRLHTRARADLRRSEAEALGVVGVGAGLGPTERAAGGEPRS
ncbi:MAG: hypothetical protein ACT4PL_13090 [Phycisphaerales bacterium]